MRMSAARTSSTDRSPTFRPADADIRLIVRFLLRRLAHQQTVPDI